MLMAAETNPEHSASFLEVKFWRLHNTAEKQSARLSEYLQTGRAPALARAGGKLVGAFSIVIGPDSPSILTVAQFPSMGAMQETFAAIKKDEEHTRALEKLGEGNGLPFVRVESSLLRSFDAMPQPAAPVESGGGHGRVFELRTYESQSFATLARKVAMFNGGEVQTFQRLGFRPVFFGETVVGPRQPNLMYMLSYDDLAAHDRLWQSFIADPEWKKLSTQPGLSDPEIVANISNTILAPLPFSPTR